MAGQGLRLVRSQGMEGFTGNLIEFPIDPTDTQEIYYGDVVNWAADGFITEGSGAANNDDFDILGVFAGCRYHDSDGSVEHRMHWDGGANRTNIRGSIAMPAHGMFKVRGNSGGTYTRANTIGHRFGVRYVAGSASTGMSAVTLGLAAAGTGPLLVHSLLDIPHNAFTSTEPWFLCTIVRPEGAPAL